MCNDTEVFTIPTGISFVPPMVVSTATPVVVESEIRVPVEAIPLGYLISLPTVEYSIPTGIRINL
jgi:hypothetical protein